MENDNKQNLSGSEAQKKIKDLAEGEICHFVTFNNTLDIITRPMSALQVDEGGNLWFISNKYSNKNEQIQLNDKVNLLFSHASKQEYLAIKGKATIMFDKDKIKELWSPFFNAWVKDGVDDTDNSLIRVQPLDGYYWDTKYGSVISFIKIASAIVTGKTDDGGIEGQLNVNM
jgi:general stress protein 26